MHVQPLTSNNGTVLIFNELQVENKIVKYIKNSENHKIGMLMAGIFNNELVIGYSSVHPKDIGKFDKEFANQVATDRALVYINRVPRYIPEHIRESLPYFVNRCEKYYKNYNIPNWVKKFI